MAEAGREEAFPCPSAHGISQEMSTELGEAGRESVEIMTYKLEHEHLVLLVRRRGDYHLVVAVVRNSLCKRSKNRSVTPPRAGA